MRKRITGQDQTSPLSSSPSACRRTLIEIPQFVLQVASEKAELCTALTEYEKDINLLESLYNNNKELLDQHKLDTDLKELAEYAWSCSKFAAGSDNDAESYATWTTGSTRSTQTWVRRSCRVLKNCGNLEICVKNWSRQIRRSAASVYDGRYEGRSDFRDGLC
jgi:hypothetical protein